MQSQKGEREDTEGSLSAFSGRDDVGDGRK